MNLTVILIASVVALLVFLLALRLLKALLSAALLALAVAVGALLLLPAVFEDPADAKQALESARRAGERVVNGAKEVGQSTRKMVETVQQGVEQAKQAVKKAGEVSDLVDEAKRIVQPIDDSESVEEAGVGGAANQALGDRGKQQQKSD